MKNIFYFCILFSTTIMQAQTSDSLQVLSPEQMKEDVLFFYKKIEEIHPNPYCVLDKKQYEIKKQELLNSLDKPMNEIEFWLKISQLQSIYDAHTGIVQPNKTIDFLIEKKSLFFFNGLQKVHNYCLYWNSLEGIPDGLKNREILMINNVKINEIINNMTNYISCENNTIINKNLNYRFCILYPLLYNYPQELHIEYLDKDTNKNITLTMDDFMQWDSISRPFWETIEPYSFKFYEDEGIAIFELNSFSESEKLQFEQFDKDLADAIDFLNKSNIKHLFVDITRNEGGGSRFADAFLDYLNIPKRTYFGEVTHKISKENREKRGFNNFKSYRKIFYSQFARDMLLTKKGKTFTRKYYYTKKQKPCTYYDNVYLLQSNTTFSAAIRLSSFFKYYNFGTIIGEETGGLTACYIDSSAFRLPNSNLLTFCSTMKSVEPGGKWDGRGVLPDIEYKIENQEKSFTLEQLKEMLQLVEEYNKNQ